MSHRTEDDADQERDRFALYWLHNYPQPLSRRAAAAPAHDTELATAVLVAAVVAVVAVLMVLASKGSA